jgi:RES domain-containing protein
LSFNRDELYAIEAWIATAKPLSAVYYRSVEYRFMDPKEVLSGRGAALYGGRFASVGTPAVFLAESDSAASEEVLARKRRLGGSAQITLDKYPRIVFGVEVSLDRVSLAKTAIHR